MQLYSLQLCFFADTVYIMDMKGCSLVMIYRYLTIVFAVLLLGVTGCSEKRVSDPPTARLELTSRLFEALKYQRYDEALAIIDKLSAISDDSALAGMRGRIIVTRCVKQVQPLIDQGKLKEARDIVHREHNNNKTIRELGDMEEKIEELIKLQKNADRLAKASTAAELDAAIKDVEYSIQDIPEAKQLKADLEVRRRDLAAMRKAEAAAREKAEQEASRKAAETRKKNIEEARKKSAEEARARAAAAEKAAQELLEKDSATDPGSSQFVGPARPQK